VVGQKGRRIKNLFNKPLSARGNRTQEGKLLCRGRPKLKGGLLKRDEKGTATGDRKESLFPLWGGEKSRRGHSASDHLFEREEKGKGRGGTNHRKNHENIEILRKDST